MARSVIHKNRLLPIEFNLILLVCLEDIHSKIHSVFSIATVSVWNLLPDNLSETTLTSDSFLVES